jgi:hypothetical protein
MKSKKFAFLILHSVTFWLSRENVTFLRVVTVLCDFDTVLCDFNDFRVLPPFLHILWVLTTMI